MPDEIVIISKDNITVSENNIESFVQTSKEQLTVKSDQVNEQLVSIGTQGPRGPKGDRGNFELTIRKSDAPLSARLIVWEDGFGVVRVLDYRDTEHIDMISGITTTGTPNTGGDVTIQRFGQMDDDNWDWNPGRIWLGINGKLTQVPPEDGNDVLVGYAVSAKRIYLDIKEPIFLEE